MDKLTVEQRDWIIARYRAYHLSDSEQPLFIKFLTANTTGDDMRKHKWSEGETNQALTTEDEPATTIQHPCPTCGQETTVYLQQEDSDE